MIPAYPHVRCWLIGGELRLAPGKLRLMVTRLHARCAVRRGKAAAVAYPKVSLRAEKRALREKMLSAGLGCGDIAAEFGRRYQIRPRAAWREAHGWSLKEAAERINAFRGDVGLDPDGLAGLKAAN